MTPDERIASKQRILNKMRVVAHSIAAPEFMMQHLDLDIHEDYLAHNLLYRLTSFVLAEDLGSHQYEVEFSAPASWWQHFKRDTRLGRLFARRWPVRLQITTKIVEGHGYRGYPHAPIALPAERLGDAVVFETFEPIGGSGEIV